jgi:predicted metal-dependent hydrolase
MSEHILQGAPNVPLTLRRSGRARRISLRISQLDGRVTLTMPNGVPEDEALAFARQKEAWIRSHLDRREEDVLIGVGSEVPVGGVAHQVVQGAGRRVVIGDGVIAVPGDEARMGARLQGHFKQMARVRLVHASDMYAERLGKSYARISIRDTRSRWGSCSSAGTLMYSWRLIMAPDVVLDYVAAHEVAHLAEMNHSKAYWAGVSRIFGDYKPARTWLRTHGNDLHRYRFSE